MNEVVALDVQEILANDLPWNSLEGSTVLVTGATGMVGYYAVSALLGLPEARDVNVNVIALARNQQKAEQLYANQKSDRLRILVQDVADEFQVDAVDLVIHAASPAAPDLFQKDPVGVIKANVVGSLNSLELARAHQAKYCFVSTMEVYGQIDSDAEEVVVKEDDFGRLNSTDPRSAYPESKRTAENLAVAYGNQYGVDYTIARLTHTYGPGMALEDTRVQADFLNKALAGDDIVLKSDGSLRRTYTYIADAVSGMFYMILKDNGDRVYNVANFAARQSIRQLAQTIIDASGADSKVVIDIDESAAKFWSKTRNTYVDTSRLEGLGWSAKVSPAQGMERTIEFHRDNLEKQPV